MSDIRLEIQYEAIYFYPDVILTCNEGDLTNKKSVSNPILLVEVLSKSTADKICMKNYSTIFKYQVFNIIWL